VIVGRSASEAFGLFGIGLFSVGDSIATGREFAAHLVSISAVVFPLAGESVEWPIALPLCCTHRLLRGVVARIMHVSCQTHYRWFDLKRN
jgi:hypothetical protein